MGPFKDAEIPLTQVKQADDTQNIEQLYGDEAQYYGEAFLAPACRESQNPRNEHDGGFDTIAARFNGNGEP